MVQSAGLRSVKKLVPSPVRLWAKDILNARRVRRNPGRIALVSEILPAYAACGGRILWIGCRRYTKDYGSCSRNAAENAGPLILKLGMRNGAKRDVI